MRRGEVVVSMAASRAGWAVSTVAMLGLLASCRFDLHGLAGLDGGAAASDAPADRPGVGDGASADGAPRDGVAPDGVPPADGPRDGASPTEQCLNGVDDDGDGLVDCLDPACQADFYCVDDPPAGWAGFFYLHQTTAADPAPSPACADGSTAARLSEGPIDSPATCSTCTCGAKQGAACAPPVFTCWAGKDKCNGSGAYDMTTELAKPQCVPGSPTNATTSCQVTAGPTVASDGTCPASTVTATRPAPWASRDDVCAVTAKGAGCGAQVCARRPRGDYGAICIRRNGDVACPGGWAMRHLAYATTTDTRDCTPCDCAPGPASCSGGAYQLFGCTTACNDHCPNISNPDPFTPGSGCQDVSAHVGPVSWSSLHTPPALAAGACTPAGGAPTGAVGRSGGATYCCRP